MPLQLHKLYREKGWGSIFDHHWLEEPHLNHLNQLRVQFQQSNRLNPLHNFVAVLVSQGLYIDPVPVFRFHSHPVSHFHLCSCPVFHFLFLEAGSEVFSSGYSWHFPVCVQYWPPTTVLQYQSATLLCNIVLDQCRYSLMSSNRYLILQLPKLQQWVLSFLRTAQITKQQSHDFTCCIH